MLAAAEGPTALPASSVRGLWVNLHEGWCWTQGWLFWEALFPPSSQRSIAALWHFGKLVCDGWGLLDRTLDPGVVAGWYLSIQQSPGAWLLQGSGQ